MEVIQYFHVNGASETSCSSNSLIQKKGIEVTKPIIEEAILSAIKSTSSWQNIGKSISIAEMGCSSGPNALLAVSYVMDTIYNKFLHELDGAQQGASPYPEILVFLNDLSSNDFNTIFKSLQAFHDEMKKTFKKLGDPDDDQKQNRCFVAGIPGSFYGRLFPSDSLHFVHSSYSLHWLSQGKIEEEQLDSFNMPLYVPSPLEVKSIILAQGSFIINRLETFEVTAGEGEGIFRKGEGDDDNDMLTGSRNFLNFMRSISESLLASHFGEEIIDELYERYREIVAPLLSREECAKTKHLSIVISMTRG